MTTVSYLNLRVGYQKETGEILFVTNMRGVPYPDTVSSLEDLDRIREWLCRVRTDFDQDLVYIAGPFTGDTGSNIHVAMDVANDVLELGGVPLIPHLTELWHIHTPRPAQFWYDYDKVILERCGAIYRYPGDSRGADDEIAHAERRGIDRFFDLAALGAWLKRRSPVEAIRRK